MNPQVDDFLDNTPNWQVELTELRRIALECDLKEEFKWRQPCYTYNKKNIVILSGFKDYCAIGFFKGSLLKDTDNILYTHGENSQSSRSIQFRNLKEITEKEQIIKAYIFEAVEIEKAGLNVQYKKLEDYEVPKELEQKFREDLNFETAFKALTPGRQKAYILHFSQAIQSKTRIARIEKFTQRILMGKGFNDCVCGHSKRMPNCDGSHKQFQN
jgi:uncharacterized protein YdeI (YjbR/CyaY-like superfamily)